MIIDGRRHLALVRFTPGAAEHTLHNPRWAPVTAADVEALVGQPVDLERGEGFFPAEPEPEPARVYAAALVVLLPAHGHSAKTPACGLECRGGVVVFTGCTAARIGEVSGVRKKDIDRANWIWNVRRQTTTAPGGLLDKGTKGKHLRRVPIISEIRPMVAARLDAAKSPEDRLFTGPRGGRISTAVLRDALTGTRS